jgi:hypothetical protein
VGGERASIFVEKQTIGNFLEPARTSDKYTGALICFLLPVILIVLFRSLKFSMCLFLIVF